MLIKKYDLSKLKSIPPEIIFSRFDIPFWRMGGGYKFRCVWRGDKDPSGWCELKDGWVWVDYGADEGGSWIDLVMKLRNCGVREAIEYLAELEDVDPEIEIKVEEAKEGSKYEIVKVFPAGNSRIIRNFFTKKGWNIPSWLKAVSFLKDGKKLFGYGVRDEQGGWHIRMCLENAVIKELCLACTSFPSLIEYSFQNVVVVEGINDAVCIDMFFKKRKINASIIILHGVGNTDKAIKIIKQKNFKKIYMGLDDDEAGRKAEEELKNGLICEADMDFFRVNYIWGKDPADCRNIDIKYIGCSFSEEALTAFDY